MNKKEFLAAVRRKIKDLPKTDVKRSLEYYEEMIADCMEDGMTEAQVVASVGTPDEVAEQILLENPMPPKNKRKPETWEIVLLCVCSPIWFPLILTAGIVLLSVYIVAWSVIISLYAAFLSLAIGGIAGIACFFAMLVSGYLVQSIFLLGVGLSLAGLSVFMLLVCNFLTSLFLKLHKTVYLNITKQN
ncbi:MAG: DUF1700 domain-containing protein [Clostridia bacterium]|nr:DUF1700 domain-containing protein [Clostridia bacterium]